MEGAWRKRVRLPHVLRRLLLSPFSSSAPTPSTSSTDAMHESSDPKGETLAFSGLFSSRPASRESFHLNFFFLLPSFCFLLLSWLDKASLQIENMFFVSIDFADDLKFSQNEHLLWCELSLLGEGRIVAVPTLFVMMATHINPTLSHQSKSSLSEQSTLQCRLPVCPDLSSVARSHRRFRRQSHHTSSNITFSSGQFQCINEHVLIDLHFGNNHHLLTQDNVQVNNRAKKSQLFLATD